MALNCASLLLLVGTCSAQVRYTVTDLGTLGNFRATATAISDSGWIVGFANTPASGYDVAVVWRGPGVAAPVAITGEGASGAFANGVNNDGLVVGISDSFSLHAYAFDAGGAGGIGLGSAVELGTLGGFVSQANGVNGAGLVVGSAMEVSGFSHAVKWVRAGGSGPFTMARLPELGGPGSVARAVNAGGVIVGAADLPSGLSVPCVWTPDGQVRPMGVEVSSFGEAAAVNDLGQAVGYAFTNTGTVAFLWDPSSGVTDLGNLGNHHAEARGINNRGEVVGHSYIPGTSATQHGFIWKNGVMTDLQTLIDPASGWVLWEATAIAQDGRIVGGGLFNGQPHAFLLTPVPCAADVGSVGGVAGADGALDNNDFVVFIDAFFTANPLADRGTTGGVAGGDGVFDNNDFVVFIDQFFGGC